MATQDKTDVNNTNRNRRAGYEALKGLGMGLLLMGIFLIGSLALAAPSAFRITVGTFSPHYSPKFVHVPTGTAVSWENPTTALHSITHDGCKTGDGCAFDSGPLGPNGTFTVQHLPQGHYPYHCTFHPVMQGVLVVTASETLSDT